MNPDRKKEKENAPDLTQELETKGGERDYKTYINIIILRFLLQQLQPMFRWVVGGGGGLDWR